MILGIVIGFNFFKFTLLNNKIGSSSKRLKFPRYFDLGWLSKRNFVSENNFYHFERSNYYLLHCCTPCRVRIVNKAFEAGINGYSRLKLLAHFVAIERYFFSSMRDMILRKEIPAKDFQLFIFARQ